MADDKKTVFVDGMIIKPRPENAPDFVKAKISFKVEEIIPFLKAHDNNGWVNVDILLSKGGKLYCALNTYKPQPKAEPQGEESDANIPFN